MNVVVRENSTVSISADEKERRREAFRRADAHKRIESLFPRPETTAIYKQFIRGEIELHDIRPRIKALELLG